VKTYRRQRQQYLFASFLGILAVVNVLFFLILYRPARLEYFRLQDSIERTRLEGQSRRQRIDRLEKLNAQLETSARDRSSLVTEHFIPKSTGWSEILPQLEAALQKANVKNVRKDYALDQMPQYGLYSVKIRLPVTGHYPNVMKFIQELEDAQTFFIINSIDVRGSNTTDVSDVGMNLEIETFFHQ